MQACSINDNDAHATDPPYLYNTAVKTTDSCMLHDPPREDLPPYPTHRPLQILPDCGDQSIVSDTCHRAPSSAAPNVCSYYVEQIWH